MARELQGIILGTFKMSRDFKCVEGWNRPFKKGHKGRGLDFHSLITCTISLTVLAIGYDAMMC